MITSFNTLTTTQSIPISSLDKVLPNTVSVIQSLDFRLKTIRDGKKLSFEILQHSVNTIDGPSGVAGA